MPINPYFNNYNALNEQRLVEELIQEVIKINGFDGYYIPMANESARDLIYGEDPLKIFSSAYVLEMYPNNVMDYGGSKNFFSKFGLELRLTMSMVVSKRSFDQRVNNGTTITRPREGDLIYVPVTNGQGELFEITFVHQNKDMSMMGRKAPYYYELEIEKFKYSQEKMETGIPDIDIIQTLEAISQEFYYTNLNNYFTVGEIVFQSPDATLANATATAELASYNIQTNIMNLNQIVGSFSVANTLTYGSTSGANCEFIGTNSYVESQGHAAYDNEAINTEANTYIDTSETNPFGTL